MGSAFCVSLSARHDSSTASVGGFRGESACASLCSGADGVARWRGGGCAGVGAAAVGAGAAWAGGVSAGLGRVGARPGSGGGAIAGSGGGVVRGGSGGGVLGGRGGPAGGFWGCVAAVVAGAAGVVGAAAGAAAGVAAAGVACGDCGDMRAGAAGAGFGSATGRGATDGSTFPGAGRAADADDCSACDDGLSVCTWASPPESISRGFGEG